MSSAAARRPAQRRATRASSRGRSRRRRVLVFVVAALAIGAAGAALVIGPLTDAVREITLPLRHEDIIRQQAREKGLDPALIAAVIYQESKFRDQTSHAGARGLMQITPDTARYIARKSGGTRFVEADLATPQINIAYGTFYLRYLLNRYDENTELAVAAYNAGETNVDRWVRGAGGAAAFDRVRDIPFPETRAYVQAVFDRRGEYRDHYADELGL
jgi:soluble lytic murein transglycosylase